MNIKLSLLPLAACIIFGVSNINARNDQSHFEHEENAYDYNLYDWNKDRLRKARQEEARQNPGQYERYERTFPKYQDDWIQQAPSRYEEGGSPGEYYYWRRGQ